MSFLDNNFVLLGNFFNKIFTKLNMKKFLRLLGWDEKTKNRKFLIPKLAFNF